MEDGTYFHLRFHPNPPSIVLYYFLTNRQAHANAAVRECAMQAPEHPENVLSVIGGDAESIILNGKDPFGSLMLSSDIDSWRDIGLPVLNSVLNQIFEDLLKVFFRHSNPR